MNDEPKSDFDETPSFAAAGGLLDLGFLTRAEASGGAPSPAPHAGDFIGRYRLIAPLGEGGFGLVWHAEQSEPIRRELALKLIKPGVDSQEIIARFEAERQALALMDHPNIAAVLDAGTTADGRPYFAMELVKGEPITTYCDRHRLSIDERLALFIPVCRAVQHAHQKAILHRDLKPSNILVATVDGRPVPKVIDFGIAKALVGNENAGLIDLVRTQMGVAIGTPRYMSPEQAGSRPDVDTRSDIYSLGVVLCELLTGLSPHPAQPTDFFEALRWIRETDPVKPSTLAQSASASATAAARRGLDVRQLARRLKGDLDWITIKALEKDRTLRYETATALARDLERHLAAEPVSAAAPTWRYQFGKFAHRRRGALIAATLVGTALIAGTVISLWQASEATKSRREAELRYAQARDAVDKYLVQVTDNSKLNQTDFVDLQHELLQAAVPFYESLSHYRGDDPKLRADRAAASGKLADIYQARGEMEKSEAAFRQTVDDLAKLVVQLPDDARVQYHLAGKLDSLGQLLSRRGRKDEALAAFADAVKIFEALGARYPESTDYQYFLEGALNNRARELVENREFQAAAEPLRKAAAIGEKLARDHPEVSFYWMGLATSASTEARAFRLQQRYADEVRVRRKAVELFDRMLGKVSNKDYLAIIAFNRWLLGDALANAQSPQEAEPVLRQAASELRALVGRFPSVTLFRTNLLGVQKQLLTVLQAQGKTAEAQAVREQIGMTQTERTGGPPPSANPVGGPGAVGPPPEAMRLAALELSTGKYREAVKRVQDFTDLNPADWQCLVAAAEVTAGAVELCRADPKADATQRGKLAKEYAAQAVAYLREAISHGYTGLPCFRSHPYAKALEQRPDYQALVAWPVAAPPHAPRRFTFEYQQSDPGPRHWVREGVTWTETQPSGQKNIYTIAGPLLVEGHPGCLLREMNARSQTAFVPDLDPGQEQSLWLRDPTGVWLRLGLITEVQ